MPLLQPYVEQLAKELDIAIPADEKKSGTYHLSFDGNTIIAIIETAHPHPQGWELKSTFGELPHENHERIFSQMLLGNLFGQGTRGAILGIDEESTKLALTLRGNWPIDYQQFRNQVEDFMNIIDMWKEAVHT